MEDLVQIQIKPSLLQLGFAVGASFALLAAGFSLGRVTAPEPSTEPVVVAQSAGDPAATHDSAETASPADVTETTAAAIAASEPVAVGDDLPLNGTPITAEALRAEIDQINLSRIEFVPGSVALTSAGAASVQQLSKALRDYPLIPAEITVTTGSEGSPGENHGLSTQQASVLVTSLISSGVEPERLVAVGLGQSAPPGVSVVVGPQAAAALAVSQIDTSMIDFKIHTGIMEPDSLKPIQRLADALDLDNSVRVEIAAHTYSESTSERNHDLSHVQGETVVSTLLDDFGLDPERLDFVGHGDPPHFAESGRTSVITFTVVR